VEFFNVYNICLNSRLWFMLYFIYISYLVWAQLSRLLPEDRDRIQSPKRRVLNKKQDSGLCQKINNFCYIPSYETTDLIFIEVFRAPPDRCREKYLVKP
jgi:hypothetical protein